MQLLRKMLSLQNPVPENDFTTKPIISALVHYILPGVGMSYKIAKIYILKFFVKGQNVKKFKGPCMRDQVFYHKVKWV